MHKGVAAAAFCEELDIPPLKALMWEIQIVVWISPNSNRISGFKKKRGQKSGL